MRYRRDSAQYVSATASTSVFALRYTPSEVPPPTTIMSTPRTSLRTKPASPFQDDIYEQVCMRRKNVMDTEERRRRLEADPWTLEVLPKLVKCRGCLRWIKLDQRSMYYGGLWNKHRDHCRCIRQIKGEQIPKVNHPFLVVRTYGSRPIGRERRDPEQPLRLRRAGMSQRFSDRRGF